MGKNLPVLTSVEYNESLKKVLLYGYETFGEFVAIQFRKSISIEINKLHENYLSYLECRHLETKSKMYRNIIIASYLIIYRITDERIEVLQIISSRMSISKIKDSRKIRVV